jgi:hypothetical protein
MAGRYDNPIPTRFLALIDCLKIPAQFSFFLMALYVHYSIISMLELCVCVQDGIRLVHRCLYNAGCNDFDAGKSITRAIGRVES